jgi:hypothetical protein
MAELAESVFVAKVRELCLENPDRVYQGSGQPGYTCEYTNSDEDWHDPNAYGCLFGVALRQLGHPVPVEYEGQSIGKVLHRMFGWGFDQDATQVSRAAEAAQEIQDVPEPWSQVLHVFDTWLAR